MARDTPVLVFREDDHYNPQLLSLGPFQGQSEGETIDLLHDYIKELFRTAGRPIHTNISDMYGVFDWHKPSLSPRPKRRTRITPFNVRNILAVASESSPFSYLEFAVSLERPLSETYSTPSLDEMPNAYPSIGEVANFGGEQASTHAGENEMTQDQTDFQGEDANDDAERHDRLEMSANSRRPQSDFNTVEGSFPEKHHVAERSCQLDGASNTVDNEAPGDRQPTKLPAWDAPLEEVRRYIIAQAHIVPENFLRFLPPLVCHFSVGHEIAEPFNIAIGKLSRDQMVARIGLFFLENRKPIEPSSAKEKQMQSPGHPSALSRPSPVTGDRSISRDVPDDAATSEDQQSKPTTTRRRQRDGAKVEDSNRQGRKRKASTEESVQEWKKWKKTRSGQDFGETS